MITERLQGHLPELLFNQLQQAIDVFAINTNFRMAHFLGQSSHESAGFKVMTENLNYSADALIRTFPKYFPASIVLQYQRNPEAIGSRIYANRMGNGNEATMDGFKFRGRGVIQLTGHDNYKAFGAIIKEDLITHPELVATKYALLSAAWFFSVNKLNVIADKGLSDQVCLEITMKVNGGVLGLAERILETNKFYSLLTQKL